MEELHRLSLFCDELLTLIQIMVSTELYTSEYKFLILTLTLIPYGKKDSFDTM